MTKLLRPAHLFLAALAYLFGASLADYLGKPFQPVSFWFGLGITVLLQLSLNLLPEVYRPHHEPLLEGETRLARRKLRDNALYVSMAALASVAVIAYALYNTNHFPPAAFFFLVLSIILILVHSIPPLRLLNRGFGEMLLAVQVGYLTPSFAFTLQSGDTHPLLATAIPVTFLALAYFIIQNFQTFSADQRYQRVTLLTRLGWERAVPLHHIFVLFAYIFFLTLPALSIPLVLVAPAFLTLPFALYQIFQLRNIALGLKPNWLILQVTALAVLGLTLYFLTFTFWTR